MAENSSEVLDKVLEQNCRPDWPTWPCILGNVAGLSSTALWFLVLLPQVWFNFRRKSVEGLSVLWATANFTASLINLFFVFLYVNIPLYGQISSVYCPILEFTLLIQFWIYGQDYQLKAKVAYAVCCLVIWATIVILQVCFRTFDYLEWAAIALWCVETFPQVLLNMKIRSTSGQATGSVFIALLGKTTDLMANNLLTIPIHYVIMTYFSSSVAYVNGLQVAWYYDRGYDLEREGQSNSVLETPTSPVTSIQKTSLSTENLIGQNRPRCKFSLCCRSCGFIVLCLLLVCCIGVLCWNIQSWLALLAPLAISIVLSGGFVFFNKRHIKRLLI